MTRILMTVYTEKEIEIDKEKDGRFTQRQLLTYCTMVQNGWNGCAKKATPTMSS